MWWCVIVNESNCLYFPSCRSKCNLTGKTTKKQLLLFSFRQSTQTFHTHHSKYVNFKQGILTSITQDALGKFDQTNWNQGELNLLSSTHSRISNPPAPWQDRPLSLPSWDPWGIPRKGTDRGPPQPTAARPAPCLLLRTACCRRPPCSPVSRKLPRLSSLIHCRRSASRAWCTPRDNQTSLSCCPRKRVSRTGSRSLCSGPLKCCWRRTASFARRGSVDPRDWRWMTLCSVVFPDVQPLSSPLRCHVVYLCCAVRFAHF